MIRKFLTPDTKQYPFDKIIKELVLALENRKKNPHPSIKAIRHWWNDKNVRYTQIINIQGENFKLHFSRPTNRLPDKTPTAQAVSRLTIPYFELEVFPSFHAMSLLAYVGGNWEKDAADWLNAFKWCSQGRRLPKTYLAYRHPQPIFQPNLDSAQIEGYLPDRLVHSTAYGEYDRESSDPPWLPTEVVLEKFRLFLEKVLQEVTTK